MNQKRKFSEIPAHKNCFNVGNKQIKQEFPEWNDTGNDFNCDLTSLGDKNVPKVEETRDNQYMLPQSKNLSHSHVIQHKLEEHWKHGCLGMRYFIDDSHLKPGHEQSASKFESKRFNEYMLPWNDNLLHRQVQKSHEVHWKHGLQGMSYFTNYPLPIVSDQNTKQTEKKIISNELLSLNNTLSQELEKKIFIEGNFIGIVRNRNNYINQECGIESNFQRGSNTYLEIKKGLKNFHVDILPLIEILSKNLYRKISIGETFISIVRNSCVKQTKNGLIGKGNTRKDSDHKVIQESIIPKNLITSHCVQKSPLFKILDEKPLFSNIPESDKTMNDSHLTVDEGQTTKHVGWTSDGKKILHPTDSLSQSFYRKIFFSKDFIGVVRSKHNKTQGNGFSGTKYAINNTKPSLSQGSKTQQRLNTDFRVNEQAVINGLRSKSKKRNINFGNQKLAFRGMAHVKTEPNTTVIPEPSQMESDDLSNEDLLPLIKILSQNLYRKITIGQDSIKILRNTLGEKRKTGSGVKRFIKPFVKKRHGMNMTHTSQQMKNNQKITSVNANVKKWSLNKKISERSNIQSTPRIPSSKFGFNRKNSATKGLHHFSFQGLKHEEGEDRKPSIEIPVNDYTVLNQLKRNGHKKYKRRIFRQMTSCKGDSCLSFDQGQISQEMKRATPSIKVEILDDSFMCRRLVQIEHEKGWNHDFMMKRHQGNPYFMDSRNQITQAREGISTSKAIVSLSDGLTNDRNVIFNEGKHWNNGLHGMSYQQNKLYSINFQEKITREVKRDSISTTILSLRDDLTNKQKVQRDQGEYWKDDFSGMCSQNFFS